MIRLLKLVLALAILYATWHAGVAFWRNYQFRDALTGIALNGTRNSNEEIQARVIVLAGEMKIPVVPEQITVSREGGQLVIEAKYVETIELLPTYHYPYLFTARGEVPILP
ncbi:MAG: hypothetical protein HYS05_12915 [Acidobacteria bacterium]|nr:hypothetical protein [Acidobacteriota bacterium]